MADIWAVLVPILLADLVNPVLFAVLVFASGTSGPVANSSMVLLGHTAGYFCVGILLAIGLERIEERLARSQPIDFFLEMVIGFLLLWVSFRIRKGSRKRSHENT